MQYVRHSHKEKYISREVSVETVKTTEAAETTRSLDSLETEAEPGLGKGRKVYSK